MSRLGRMGWWSVCLLAACTTNTQPREPDVTVRIENGVTIVEHAGLHLADSLGLSVDTVNVVRIGEVEGADEYVIGRLAGTLLRPDGTILIADATTNDLRIFDAQGRFVRRIGRKGEGPGEFTWLTEVYAYTGDSLIVMDHESSRANVLDPQYGYVRRYRPTLKETRATPPMTSHRLEGFFSGGRPLMSDYLSACDRREQGFCEDSTAFFSTDEKGNTVGRFGSFVYERRESFNVEPGLSTGWTEPHPQAIWAVRGPRFYYADAKRFEILVFDRDGRLVQRIRVKHTAPRFAKQQVWPTPVAAPPSTDPRSERARAVLRNAQAKAQLPDTFPVFSDLLVDDEANVWVREYLPPVLQREVRPRWFVFDPDGKLRWSVRSPPGMIRYFRPYLRRAPHIARDRVLASVRDADGVESVIVYPLTRK